MISEDSESATSMSDFESGVSELQDTIDSDLGPDEGSDYGTDNLNVQDNDLPVNRSPSLPSSQDTIPPNGTDPNKSDRKTRVSAIRSGLEGLKDGLEPTGLLKFWKRGTEDERKQYFEREAERHKELMEKEKYSSDRKKQVETDIQRERARLRKQKSRARKRESKNREKKRRVRNSHGLVKLYSKYNLCKAGH